MAGGWNASKKFRLQLHKLLKQATVAERRWKAIIDSRVKVYTPAEIEAYSKARGIPTVSELHKKKE